MDRPTMPEISSSVRLMSVRRTVAEDAADGYYAAWLGCVTRSSRSAGRPGSSRVGTAEAHLEFLESRRLAEIVEDDDVSAAIQALDEAFGPGTVELWEDAPLMTEREELRDLLLARSIRRGDFVLASGARSNYYIDARPTTMSGHGQRLIGRLGLAAIDEAGWRPSVIGGLTLGADPVAYAMRTPPRSRAASSTASPSGKRPRSTVRAGASRAASTKARRWSSSRTW